MKPSPLTPPSEIIDLCNCIPPPDRAPDELRYDTRLYNAICADNLDAVREYLNLGASARSTYAPPSQDHRTAFETAVYRGSYDIVRVMISAGADVDCTNLKSSVLGLAIKRSDLEMVKLLAEYVDLSKGDDFGAELVSYAREVGADLIVRFLQGS